VASVSLTAASAAKLVSSGTTAVFSASDEAGAAGARRLRCAVLRPREGLVAVGTVGLLVLAMSSPVASLEAWAPPRVGRSLGIKGSAM
jgi:hypothetical protein